jgi:hypothetical protein
VTPEPSKVVTQPILGEEKFTWLVYPIETIIAEKLHPLVRLGADNSRSKDIFDLAQHLPNASTNLVKKAIQATFDYRGDAVPRNIGKFLAGIDRKNLRRGWKAATGTMKSPPDFDDAFDAVVRWFGENLKVKLVGRIVELAFHRDPILKRGGALYICKGCLHFSFKLRTRAGDPRTRFTIGTIVRLNHTPVSYRPVSNDIYVLAYILSVERQPPPLNVYYYNFIKYHIYV